MSKKLQEKQRRRLAEERKRAEMQRAQRRRNIITIVLAIIVTGGVVWLITDEKTSKPSSDTKVGNFGVSESAAGCDSIQTVKPQEGKHIEQGADHPPYNTNPPTSGPHYSAPLAPIDTGFYDSDIEPEKVVHNLEHGQIVIWYRPDAPRKTIDDIETATEEVPAATVAVPWNDIDAPKELVITAWGHLQPCVQMSKDVLDHFRELYQGKGPENVGTPTFQA